MAKRTRTHILEEESIREFHNIIPSNWLIREKNKDYGIDCEIEIFDKNGQDTGLVFWVQLKATDSNKKQTITNYSFPRNKIEQFLSYDVPVLIVRYSSFNKQIYFKWVIKNIQKKEVTKNINISFRSFDIWHEGTPAIIVDQLKIQRSLKKGKIYFPLTTFISIDPDCNKNLPVINFLNLKTYFELRHEYFSISKNEATSQLTVLIIENDIYLNIGNLVVTKINFTLDELKDINNITLQNHILIALAEVLFEVGEHDLGQYLVLENNLLDILYQSPGTIIELLPSLLHGQNVGRILEKLNVLLINDEDKKDNFLECFISLVLVNNKNKGELEAYEVFMQTQLQIALNLKDKNLIGTNYYNIGNYYRIKEDYSTALEYYFKARIFNPDYKNRSYFYQEIAGIFFLLKRFLYSSYFYKKSIELNDDINVKLCYGEALMHTGKFLEAMNIFQDYINNSLNDIRKEGILLHHCLSFFLEEGYPPKQQRNSKKANTYLHEQKYKEALEEDLLSPLACFNKGIYESHKLNYYQAFNYFIFSALLDKSDIEAWVLAVVCSINFKGNENFSLLFYSTIQVAYYYNNNLFLIELHKRLTLKNNLLADRFIMVVEQIIEEIDEPTNIIRIFGQDDLFCE
ncbi:DUF4365 domain-containing protein [Myroides phaeus]|uniref:DUF4365 domain-containing protein n=1 Tax=Myroides phaeus TaxID=702745 RepID=A0A1G8FQB6_9FLAO|nr:DUF4365 domain-containing protein [Myroides phaeus]SDH84284.1 protein of unknown function [Myroides phaeus]